MREFFRAAVAVACAVVAPVLSASAAADDAPELQVLRSLDPVSDDGSNVSGSFGSNRLLLARDGRLYGTTPRGGANNCGTVFALSPRSRQFTVLHTFSVQSAPQVNEDGCVPTGTLIQARDGALYGSTQVGGANGTGVLFRISTRGEFSVLYTFPQAFSGGAASPSKALVEGRDGNLYGVTSLGGSAQAGNPGDGTIFMVSPTGAFAVLHRFSAPGPVRPSSLILGRDGFFYGTTSRSASPGEGSGTLFRFVPGFYQTLYTFPVLDSAGLNSTGAAPLEALTELPGGRLDGVTSAGGPNGSGTVFRYSLASGSVAVRHEFGAVDADGRNSDGYGSVAPLVRGEDGALYSTQGDGGPAGGGVIYRLSRNDRLTVVHAFSLPAESGSNVDGAGPLRGVIFGPGGYLYGGTATGGAHGQGTLFRVRQLD